MFFCQHQQGRRLRQRLLLAMQLALQFLDAPLVRLVPLRLARLFHAVARIRCSQANRHTRTCSTYNPLLRQYAASPSSFRPAVSSTTANFAAESQSSACCLPPPGINNPAFLATLRQLYSVVSVMPVSRANSATDRLSGGIIRFNTACFSSSEYLDISHHFPTPAYHLSTPT